MPNYLGPSFKVKFVEKNEMTNIQGWIEKNDYLPTISKETFSDPASELKVFDSFFSYIDFNQKDSSNNEEKIFNNSLNRKFKQELIEDEKGRLKISSEGYEDLVMVVTNRLNNNNNKKEVKVYKAETDNGDVFQKWTISLKNREIKLDELLYEITNKSKEVEKKIKSENEEISSFQSTNTELNIEIEKKNNDISSLKYRVNSIQSKIDDLTSDLENINKEKKGIEQNIKNYQKEELKNKKNDKKNKIKNPNQKNDKPKINELTNKKQDLSSQENEIKIKLQENENNKKAIQDEIDSNNSIVESLQNKIIDNDNKIKSKNDNISMLEKELNSIKKIKEGREKYFKTIVNEDKCFFYQISMIEVNANNKNQENDFFPYTLTPLFVDENRPDILNAAIYDPGLVAKLKRYKFAIENAKQGYVRNPLMFPSLLNPSLLEFKAELSDDIKEKWKLNDKQYEAVRGMISTNNTFYLQGPPGTGKTQTICATIQHFVNNNSNVLIVSSTHEAINNCLERFNNENQDDPNIIIYKKSRKINSDEKDTNIFNVDNLYKNFLIKIKNKLLNKDTNRKELQKSDILNAKNSLEDIFLPNQSKNYIPYVVWNKIYNIKNADICKVTNKKISEILYDCAKHREYDKDNETLNFTFDKFVNNELYKSYWNVNKYKDNEAIISNFRDKGNTLIETLCKIFKTKGIVFFDKDGIYKYLEEALKHLPDTNNKLLENFTSNEKINDEKNYEFKEYIEENNLINVLAYTTTAETKLELTTNEPKDIWFDYPIDTVIMDESSKSNTPEVLARINISHKFIMCGDYKQLPPTSEFKTDDFLKNIFNSIENKIKNLIKNGQIENNEIDVYKNNFKELFNIDFENSESENNCRKFCEVIDKTFTTPFFKNQIKKIKKQKDKKSMVYSFLNKQYRFNPTIQNLVNNFYDNDEKLENGKDRSDFDTFKFTKDEDQKIFVIDTTRLSHRYISTIKMETKTDEAFDQTSLLKKIDEFKDLNIAFSSLFNQYNAFIVIKILEKLVYENAPEKLTGKIGVICLTLSQKIIVRHLINKNKELKNLNIKIDTIDNFQGKEKEIIIVDFVRSKNKFNGTSFEVGKRNISFLAEEERINVAASRTKNLLFLIGAFDYYDDIRNDFKENKLLIKYIDHWQKKQEGIELIEGEDIYEEVI
ncbi:AAA domain-containing protein [Mycoplasmopsis equigenitalium]|uniref:AAA domain-containing protein n=1 Tax=Mycoplasmopsis equigenitalium TaxID=114883 RepID=A0ABY5J0S1_9BACT|nr:AAA domain-containing protein [Mycoplasmopsis equigenitalium]UUD36856.1 AAA domain-containing protein [Mycoplasmopsis equigenitalium]